MTVIKLKPFVNCPNMSFSCRFNMYVWSLFLLGIRCTFLAYKDRQCIKEKQIRHAVDDNDMFKFNHVTQVYIFRKLSILEALDHKVAGAYDHQPPSLFKLRAPILSYTLLPILNNALEYNVSPMT